MDSIYPALSWLIPSFKKDPRSVAKKEFNKNLSKARIYPEIAFGRMKRIFKEVGWRSGLDIDFLPQVVHACYILNIIVVDIKEIDFNSVFNEMDACRALLQSDRARGHHEPVVDRRDQSCQRSCLHTLFFSSPIIFNRTKPLELDICQKICELTCKLFV
jgi:hypothetical protein